LVQRCIHDWYFCFLFIFVLPVFSLGLTVMPHLEAYMGMHSAGTKALISNMGELLPFVTDNLVHVTQFYMLFMMWQWVSHALSLTRYVHLFRSVLFRNSYEDEALAVDDTPSVVGEDQDFQGMGSRNARATLLLIIALVCSSMNPLIIVVALVNFALCRVVWGYLCVFSESNTADSGGEFWVSALQHLQFGLGLYSIVMCFMLSKRSDVQGPAYLAFASLLCLIVSLVYFNRKELDNHSDKGGPTPSSTWASAKGQPFTQEHGMLIYEQPELLMKPSIGPRPKEQTGGGCWPRPRSFPNMLSSMCTKNGTSKG